MVPVSPLSPCVATKAIFLGHSIGQPELYHSVVQVSLENMNEVIPPHVSSTSMCSTDSPKEQVPQHCSCGRGSAKKDGRKFCHQAPNGNKSRLSATLKQLVAPIDVNVLIVEILMAPPRLPSRHTHM